MRAGNVLFMAQQRSSHQTGWTGLIARSIDLFARLNATNALQIPRDELLSKMTREQVAGVGNAQTNP
jgi:hypothetical protein